MRIPTCVRTPSRCAHSRPKTASAGSATPSATDPTVTGNGPGGPGPSAAEIREDLDLMLPHWNLLRIYRSRGFAETLLQIIRDDGLDMKVVLGVWIAPDDVEANRREVDTAVDLANAYPGIVIALSVGNETQIFWSAHRSPLDILLDQRASGAGGRRRYRSPRPTISTAGTSRRKPARRRRGRLHHDARPPHVERHAAGRGPALARRNRSRPSRRCIPIEWSCWERRAGPPQSTTRVSRRN